MIYKETAILEKAALEAATAMVVAARTAPKGRGRNNIDTLIVSGINITALRQTMNTIGEKSGQYFFKRDAANLEHALAIVLIATKISPAGLAYCSLCGFKSCNEKENYPDTPCTFNNIDLGIATGSAVSIAADRRFDNRIMYTIGMAALELGLFSKEFKIILGIPLSAGSKNPFFDRS